ncbi:hypothetical protein COV23_01255 [Candidatus Wolfebacteria bacterium CG10_big_fil_rev_8_21_14_0_10_31_9]|uniref:PEGA domain-containing protein n=1 Tax=Candidatus Wolfebacteria bacterium CG10_big_fil_rev_8_21_14_0_10_31_9 TaxID=1975070 RepID=A0A2H0REE7_9BACT|nr:MAG: hypothetical protein COV23_01255 [Candidatus Wolfebacteria bacterium CG10_big_fil_rev_8_21_14_0_10_31_9]
MNRKTTRIIFIIFVFIFIIVGITAVFYSLGYRINFKNYKIQKTGGIYIKTQPKNVIIKISSQNEFEKIYPDTSSIIQSGTLIQNLLPKIYNVKIDKTSYLPYYKTLKIEESLVAELFNIFLIPEKIKVDNFISVRGNIIIDSNNNTKFIIQNEKTGIYYLYDINNPEKILNLSSLYSNTNKSTKIKKITFVPFNPQNFIVEDSSGLNILDSEHLSITSIIKAPLFWGIKNSNIYFIKKSPDIKNPKIILYSYNLVFQKETAVIQIPKNILSSTTLAKIKASDGNDKVAFLDEFNSLYLFNQSKNSIEKISANVTDFDFSQSNEILAYLNLNGQINILFFKDYNGEITQKAGDKIEINLSNKELIKSIAWYEDSFHLFVKYPNEIYFTEINILSQLNVYKILSNVSQLYYNIKNNNLFFINSGNLQGINFNNL